jgi:hypothetical protein
MRRRTKLPGGGASCPCLAELETCGSKGRVVLVDDKGSQPERPNETLLSGQLKRAPLSARSRSPSAVRTIRWRTRTITAAIY